MRDDELHTVVLRGLCNNDHNDPCDYPACKCPDFMREEYGRGAHAVLNAIRDAGLRVSAVET
jgi:hypothetical protein